MRTLRSLGQLALLVVGLVGCSSESSDPATTLGDPLLDPPPAESGFQLRMQTRIEPGVEGEWCKFVMGPEAEYHMNRQEVRYTPGSHHFLLYETTYDQIPTQKDDGTPVDTSGIFDCSSGATDGWSVVRLLGGSQSGEGGDIALFPPNVAMKVPANRVLLMNAHYLNVSQEPLDPEVAINLWTVPSEQVEMEGDILFLYNPFIKVQASGTGRARWRCPVNVDITLGSVQSHMHRRGVGFEARVAGQALFYENTDWDNVPVKQFEGGLTIPKGSQLDYYCDYANSEARDVYQGPRTTDEMCMLVGPYWPADPATSNCIDAKGDYAGEWVGNGSASCAESWACIIASLDDDDVVSRIADCMDVASPDVAKELSAALDCIINKNALEGCEAPIAACDAM